MHCPPFNRNKRAPRHKFFPTFCPDFLEDVAEHKRVSDAYGLENSSLNIHYHVKARLKDGREAVLVDPGAHDNLTGSAWVDRVRHIADKYGLEVSMIVMPTSLSVGGVGKGSQTCMHKVSVPMALADGSHGLYHAPVVPNSEMPALLGNKTMCRMKVLLNLGDGKFIIPGSGSVRITLPAGSRVLDMEMSESGHWMLPITEYARREKMRQKESFVVVSEDVHSKSFGVSEDVPSQSCFADLISQPVYSVEGETHH